MYNWSTDEKKLKKDYPAEYKIWRLLQLINYGLDGEKLDFKEIKTLWPKIKNRVEGVVKRKYLQFLLND